MRYILSTSDNVKENELNLIFLRVTAATATVTLFEHITQSNQIHFNINLPLIDNFLTFSIFVFSARLGSAQL